MNLEKAYEQDDKGSKSCDDNDNIPLPNEDDYIEWYYFMHMEMYIKESKTLQDVMYSGTRQQRF